MAHVLNELTGVNTENIDADQRANDPDITLPEKLFLKEV